MSSVVDICNQAIGFLGSEPIISLDDATREAQLCKLNFEPVRDAVMAEAPWSFATLRISLNPEASRSPVFGYLYSYLIPTPGIRILEVSDDPEFKNGANNFDYRVEDRRILCDEPSTIYVKGTAYLIDPGQWPAMFAQAVAVRLAHELCNALTRNVQLMRELWGLYETKLERAILTDQPQGKKDTFRSDYYLRVR